MFFDFFRIFSAQVEYNTNVKEREFNVVTGAFGYTGKYITRLLLARGKRVRTLTDHPDRPNPFGECVSTAPFCFDDPARLTSNLRGATTLFNTYWIRFAYRGMTFAKAVSNTQTLIQAAKKAGLRRIVHLSITNPDEHSDLPYFKGKAMIEGFIKESGLSYAIIRPTVIFGQEDILINNIAWLLRRFPIFTVPGSGDYQLQPVFVEDLADLVVRASEQDDNVILDAVGPDVFSFNQLLHLIRRQVHSSARIIHLPASLAHLLSAAIGCLLTDVLMTRDEVAGLTRNLLISDSPLTCSTRLTDWLSQNWATIGRRYANELQRHYR